MALVPLEQLNRWIEASGACLVGTEAAAAYLESLLRQITPLMRPQITTGLAQIQPWRPTDPDWLTQSQPWVPPTSGWLHEMAQAEGYVPEAPSEIPDDLRLVARRIIDTVPIKDGSGEIEYDLLTLTPWDIGRAIAPSEFLSGIFEVSDRLPVSLNINGNIFTHHLTLDIAMGIFLLSRIAQVDFEMTMFGRPLTYFIAGQDDRYKRYDENERSIQMLGVDRRYYFVSDDFLLGIKTAAQWLGVDHHLYWVSCQDAEGQPLTF